jgi:PAS domain S-box-containing protein
MARPTIAPTGVERFLPDNGMIVSKTDTRGIITYANRLFLDVAGYANSEAIGKPHNIVRHPDMPRCVFKLLWDRIANGQEIFAYVVNMAKNGDHYWVFAHATPSYDDAGNVTGYHSNRRCPRRAAIAAIEPLYRQLVAKEAQHRSPKEGLAASEAMLAGILKDKGVDYDQFVFSL